MMAAKFSCDLLNLGSVSDDEEHEAPVSLTDSEPEGEEPARPPKPTHIQKLLRAEAKRKRCEADPDVCSLDTRSEAGSGSDDEVSGKPAVSSPIQQPGPGSSNVPARKLHVPMDPVLQAERIKAMQVIEALKRAQEEEIIFSQTDSEVDPVPARQQGRAQAEQAAASANGRDDAEEAEEGEEEEEELEEEELKIVLKIKSSFHTDGLKLRIGVEQPFKKLFKVYEDQGHKAGWLPKGARVVFKFDGEPLGGGDTAKHLDMEDEDVIDACW